MSMSPEKRFELVKRNTEEIVTEKELKDLLKKKKNPVVYLGTAITGRPHVSYFLWVLKLADFINAGFKVKLLLADLHGVLDGTPWNVLERRYDYYEKIIPLMFKAVGVNIKNLEIVKGSEFQLKPEYMYDVLKASSLASVGDLKRAASDVVKMSDNPKLSGLIYPIMQAVDEQYLGVDVQYGGIDQRKILMFAREYLPKIGYKSRIEFMTPLISGLIGKKMSASDEKSKIDLLDDEKTIRKKLKNAECVAGNPDNGIMDFLKYVIMTVKQDKKKKFSVKRKKEHGGDLSYQDYEKLEKDFIAKKLHPLDLKNAVAYELIKLLEPIQRNREELEKLARKAYS
ncbi:MAG TPA: tyrosine--tRNA ligase [Candidatus Pacearchaeota archaeon]|nr:tyrosine--tRNA ligase [Candidatus Pacearchaeota archaeon]